MIWIILATLLMAILLAAAVCFCLTYAEVSPYQSAFVGLVACVGGVVICDIVRDLDDAPRNTLRDAPCDDFSADCRADRCDNCRES